MTTPARRGGTSSRGPMYVLRLFVTGMTARSSRAVENIRSICDEVLPDQYELRVIDVYQQPGLAASEQIIAAPTLIKTLPLPRRRIIGDLSNRQRVLDSLALPSRP